MLHTNRKQNAYLKKLAAYSKQAIPKKNRPFEPLYIFNPTRWRGDERVEWTFKTVLAFLAKGASYKTRSFSP